LSKFLLRHGEVYRAGKAWTKGHGEWLNSRHFDDAALAQTYSHYRAIVGGIDAHVAAVESDLKIYLGQGPFSEAVARLSAYRGVTELGALTLSAEVCDWRRFPRATSLMGFCGLVPSEYSSGDRVRRGRITKAGNTHLRTQLVEAAWAYQHRAYVGPEIKKRQDAASPETIARAWAAQLHLCSKFHRLSERKSNRKVVVTAIARELAGFLWAEMAA
jgi:transposase